MELNDHMAVGSNQALAWQLLCPILVFHLMAAASIKAGCPRVLQDVMHENPKPDHTINSLMYTSSVYYYYYYYYYYHHIHTNTGAQGYNGGRGVKGNNINVQKMR